MRPRIAIPVDMGEGADGDAPCPVAEYAEAVRRAGGEPVFLRIPPETVPVPVLAERADGLLLPGGGDLDAEALGEPLHPSARPVPRRRWRVDLALLAEADRRGMPVLGICLGMQEMAVHRGGRIVQHLPDEPAALLDHGRAGRPRLWHPVEVVPGTLLAATIGYQAAAGPIQVNSRHHQAVRDPGRGMRISARAPDGVIEAVEAVEAGRGGRFFLGVQWHPEALVGSASAGGEAAAEVQIPGSGADGAGPPGAGPEVGGEVAARLDSAVHLALFVGLCRAAAAWRAG